MTGAGSILAAFTLVFVEGLVQSLDTMELAVWCTVLLLATYFAAVE